MLFELSITPLGGDEHLSDELAAILKIIDESGLPYQLTPTATCIEGEWDEVMQLIRRCHEHARTGSKHVITTIKIEDDEGEQNQLVHNVASVEEKVGHALNKAKS